MYAVQSLQLLGSGFVLLFAVFVLSACYVLFTGLSVWRQPVDRKSLFDRIDYLFSLWLANMSTGLKSALICSLSEGTTGFVQPEMKELAAYLKELLTKQEQRMLGDWLAIDCDKEEDLIRFAVTRIRKLL
jgi:hypothetical protein